MFNRQPITIRKTKIIEEKNPSNGNFTNNQQSGIYTSLCGWKCFRNQDNPQNF